MMKSAALLVCLAVLAAVCTTLLLGSPSERIANRIAKGIAESCDQTGAIAVGTVVYDCNPREAK